MVDRMIKINYSFPVWMHLFFLSLLIALVRISNMVFNKSDENQHPYLVPNLRGKTFSFSMLSMVLTVVLSYKTFVMLRYLFFILILSRAFTINVC